MNHLFAYFDRTLIHPNVTIAEQDEALDEVNQLGLAGLVVAPFWVKKHRRDLGTAHPATLTATVGFPYGYQRTEVKQLELELALTDGANAVEVALNTSAFFSPSSVWLKIELAKLVALAHAREIPLTVVLETTFFTPDQCQRLIKLAADAGADGFKNSTGVTAEAFSLKKALLFRQYVPADLAVYIRADGATQTEMETLMAAGVNRLGLQALPSLSTKT